MFKCRQAPSIRWSSNLQVIACSHFLFTLNHPQRPATWRYCRSFNTIDTGKWKKLWDESSLWWLSTIVRKSSRMSWAQDITWKLSNSPYSALAMGYYLAPSLTVLTQERILTPTWRRSNAAACFQTQPSTMSDPNPYDLPAKYKRFRILVIGWANAGKTTLLQRVCNTTEDPCIYDKNNKNLVSLHRPEDEFCFWKFSLAWTYLRGNPLTTDLLLGLTLPMQRGIHDIHRSFAFKSNPGFIFHDSPGFSAGNENQLREVLSYLEEKAKSTEVDDRLHAIWWVSLSQLIYWPLMVSSAVKVLFSSQISAAPPTGNEDFWDGEGRKWFLLPHL